MGNYLLFHNSTAMTKSFFSPEGRINRKTYFLRILAIGLPAFGLRLITGHILDPFMLLLANWLIIGSMFVTLVQMAKRLHDLSRPGWWSLFILVPFVNIVLGFYMLLAPGSPEGNAYGQVPS